MLFGAGWALLLGGIWAVAPPGIGQNGIVNKASRIPPTLESGILARGAAFTIRGVHFGSQATVVIRKDGITAKAQVLASTQEKIEAVVPEAAPLGAAEVIVTAGGVQSKPFPVRIATSNPGIFSVNDQGWGPGRIENIEAGGKRTLNSASNPAHPEQRIVMRITGLAKGTSARIVIGNRTVQSGVARALAAPGEQEVLFPIPAGAPAGCYVPVYFETTSERASNVVTMAISASKTCDPGPIPLLDEQRIGIAVFARSDMVLVNGSTTTGDEVIVLFIAKGAGPVLSPLRLLPPPGTCTAYASSFQNETVLPDSAASALVAGVQGNGLSAGAQLLAIRGKYFRAIPGDRAMPGYYRTGLGSYQGKRRSLLLEPGNFVFSGKGGTDVGAFSVTAQSPAPFEWTNRTQTKEIDRKHPLSLNWSGQAAGQMTVILATNVDQVTTAIGTSLCTAPLNSNRFEIPTAFLANIPKTSPIGGIPYDQLFVISLAAKVAVPIKAPGIDSGAIIAFFASGRVVEYH